MWAGGGTTYLCAVDGERNAVSWIQSIFEGFGAGVAVGDTGIALQNRGAGFTEEEGHPNRIAPGSARSTRSSRGCCCATVACRDPSASWAAACRRRPTSSSCATSSTAGSIRRPRSTPRASASSGGERVALEPGLAALADDLRARGHDVHVAEAPHGFGVGQMILAEDDALVGGSDGRADGHAAGL